MRPDWNHYFMGFARAAAVRGTCDRKFVGAVIVVNKQIAATGYNGSVRGMPHCSGHGPHEFHWPGPDEHVCRFCDVKVAGATPGEECPKAPEAGHDMRNGSCVRTIHAEMNALAQAASRGVSVEGAAIYSTASPCWACFRVLANAGIREFFFAEEYKSGGNDDLPRIEEVAKTLNLVVRQVAE